MTADELCEVIVTAPDHEWLIDLCRELVDAELAASAHVIHPVTSIYRWDGAVHETTEARAFLRSRRGLLDELAQFVVARHPYQVPNVTALPIVGGNPDYLAWVHAETASSETQSSRLGRAGPFDRTPHAAAGDHGGPTSTDSGSQSGP